VCGNQAKDQFQLDVFGEALQLLATAARHDRLDGDGIRAMRGAAAAIEQCWQQPDAGIWEIDDEWWTQSRLSCVAGLRAAARSLPADPVAGRWDDLAATILAETSRRCLSPDGWWRRSPRHDSTDASQLLPPVRGALPADDPRTRATLRQVVDRLSEDGYVYRFDHENGHPLGQDEGAFTLCGFITSLATAYDGDAETALRWFERTRSVSGPPGLLTEEFDVRQRQLRGNLPQAFTHALLLETAQRLASHQALSPGTGQRPPIAEARFTHTD
jgi:GH15 family glucan-1,4-alpha-glucosidase